MSFLVNYDYDCVKSHKEDVIIDVFIVKGKF